MMARQGKYSEGFREAVQKETGRFFESFNPEAVVAFEAWQRAGEHLTISEEARGDYEDLCVSHQFHQAIDTSMMEEFKEIGGCLLSIYLEEHRRKALPLAYLIKVFYNCKEGFGFIPLAYYAPNREAAKYESDPDRFAIWYLEGKQSGERINYRARDAP